jgi:hypothetical protein
VISSVCAMVKTAVAAPGRRSPKEFRDECDECDEHKGLIEWIHMDSCGFIMKRYEDRPQMPTNSLWFNL